MAELEKALKGTPKETQVDMKAEMEAITGSMKLFEKVPLAGRERAYSYLGSALGLSKMIAATPAGHVGGGGSFNPQTQHSSGKSNTKYATFADLYDAARPESGAQKALVGGYWFQVCGQAEDFVAADVNKSISNVAGPLANVTVAFDTLKALKPAQVIQVGKSGKAQQARKRYKLTIAGIRAVEEMIARES